MRNLLMGALLCCSLCLPGPSNAGQETTPKNPIIAWMRGSLSRGETNIVKSAELMPEELYGMRPGPQTEVRTFGQLVGHLANFSYIFCSDAKGEKNPVADHDFEKLATKAELVKALKASFGYCDGVFAGITDANLTDTISATRDDGSKVPAIRIARLVAEISHNQEHYGNIVTYFRIKGMVPPTSQP